MESVVLNRIKDVGLLFIILPCSPSIVIGVKVFGLVMFCRVLLIVVSRLFSWVAE